MEKKDKGLFIIRTAALLLAVTGGIFVLVVTMLGIPDNIVTMLVNFPFCDAMADLLLIATCLFSIVGIRALWGKQISLCVLYFAMSACSALFLSILL